MLSIQSERDQLVKHWTNCNYERLRSYAARILLLIQSDEPYSKVGGLIREFHNILGYKAKDTLERGGVCAGAIYRTVEFINMPQHLRSGSKSSANKVHIEHTNPVSQVYKALKEVSKNPNISGEEFAWQIMKYSITTAMLSEQGHTYSTKNHNGLVLPKHASTSNVLTEDHEHYNRPFMRYTAQSNKTVIYNVLTGNPIDVTIFTMNDFHRDLAELLTICKTPDWLLSQATKV